MLEDRLEYDGQRFRSLTTAEWVAAGTALSGGTRTSGRAELPHPTLTSGVWQQSVKVDLVLDPRHATDSRCCHTPERVRVLLKCPGRGSLRRVSLSRSSFLHSLRRRQGGAFVREFLRYYTTSLHSVGAPEGLISQFNG